MPDKFDINAMLKNLSEDEMRQLNKATQEKLSAIDEEKIRIQKLKENYSLNNIPSTWQVNYENLGEKIEKYFKEPQEILLDVSSFYELRNQCLKEIKPEREEIYPCPQCGRMQLCSQLCDCYLPLQYIITCTFCNFTIDKKENSELDAWRTFHDWLIKNGYLDENVKFQW